MPQFSNTLNENNFSIDVETKEDKKTDDIQAEEIKTIEDTSDLVNDVFVTKGTVIYNKLQITFVVRFLRQLIVKLKYRIWKSLEFGTREKFDSKEPKRPKRPKRKKKRRKKGKRKSKKRKSRKDETEESKSEPDSKEKMVDAIKKLETELVKGQHSETELLTNIYTSLQGLGIGLRKVEKQIHMKGKSDKN